MPNLAGYLEEHPDWKTAITAPDGNIYSLPSIDATAYTADSIPYVNKDWAAQVMQDLDLTQPMDLETFEALLTAFKNSDPNGNGKADEIPWSVGGNGVDFLRWSGSFGIFDSYSAPNNTSHLYLDGDTVKYAPMQEGYKEFVKWLNGLWSKGLIDVEAFTQDSATLSAKPVSYTHLDVYKRQSEQTGELCSDGIGIFKNLTGYAMMLSVSYTHLAIKKKRRRY